MTNHGAGYALVKLAEKEGISLKELTDEIQTTINIAYAQCDEETKKEWAQIPCTGEIPTPEELVTYVAGQVQKRLYENGT